MHRNLKRTLHNNVRVHACDIHKSRCCGNLFQNKPPTAYSLPATIGNRNRLRKTCEPENSYPRKWKASTHWEHHTTYHRATSSTALKPKQPLELGWVNPPPTNKIRSTIPTKPTKTLDRRYWILKSTQRAFNHKDDKKIHYERTESRHPRTSRSASLPTHIAYADRKQKIFPGICLQPYNLCNSCEQKGWRQGRSFNRAQPWTSG